MIEKKFFPSFLESHSKYLERWLRGFLDTLDSVDYIVAISRKGPRFLQLLLKHKLIASARTREKIRSKLISEQAIAFLPKPSYSSLHFLVCDDVVVHGSTYFRVVRSILDHYPDAIVRGMPFAVSKSHDPDVRPWIHHFGLLLTENSRDRYLRSFIQSLRSLSGPLLLCHPVVEADVDICDVKQASEIVLNFAKRIGSNPLDISGTVPGRGSPKKAPYLKKFYAWSVPLALEKDAMDGHYNRAVSFKFYYDETDQRLRISPSCFLSFCLGHHRTERPELPWWNFLKEQFAGDLQDVARTVLPEFSEKNRAPKCVHCTPPCDRNAHYEPKNDLECVLKNINQDIKGNRFSVLHPSTVESLTTFHNYLAALQCFTSQRDNLNKSFAECALPVPKYDIDPLELQFIVGPRHAQNCLQRLRDFTNNAISMKIPYNRPCYGSLPYYFPRKQVDRFANDLLEQKNCFDEHPKTIQEKRKEENQPKQWDLEARIKVAFDMFLWRQHFNLEVLSRKNSLKASRLSFGCNFEWMKNFIFHQANVDREGESEEAHFVFQQCFDAALDAAYLVPIQRQEAIEYKPDIQFIINDPGIKRYDVIESSFYLFRIGEGIPYCVQAYYADKLISDVCSEFGLSSLSFDLYKECKEQLELGEEIPNFPVPLYVASFQETVSLWGIEFQDKIEAVLQNSKRQGAGCR